MSYVLDNWHKFALTFLLIVGYGVASTMFLQYDQGEKTEQSLHQLSDNGSSGQEMLKQHYERHYIYYGGWCAAALLVFLVFIGDLRRLSKTIPTAVVLGALILSSGCRRPFEPVKFEKIQSNEEAFLLPLVGDAKKQDQSNNEDYLKANLVYTKQVQIPQQWHAKGRDTDDGEWIDAAILIKVDKSPVTREWTADPNSGTSNKNEAVWVMTADQVEFSTGWTITARIESREAAIKFLHNYPNGSLTTVMDSEIRGRLQAVFGLEVTDLPMEELRKNATPHIVKTTDSLTKFFSERGITITNLGITGGFVYKDRSIIETMTKVFNSEQERAIAIAKAKAQEELNKAVILEAQGKADAILKTKKAEAEGIRLVADARNYEVEKAKDEIYVKLKQLELQKELIERWDGKYPQYFIGSSNPNMLLQLPALEKK